MVKKPSHHRRLPPRACNSVSATPPRFLKTATDILGYPPIYLQASKGQHEYQVLPPQTHGQSTQSTAASSSLLTSLSGEPLLETQPSSVQLVPQKNDWSSPRPLLGWGQPADHPTVSQNRSIAYGLSSSVHLSPATYPSPLPLLDSRTLSDGIASPVPRRPVLLPNIRGPFLSQNSLQQSFHAATHADTKALPQPHMRPSDYSIDIRSIFREGSQFLPPMTAADTLLPASLPLSLDHHSPVLEPRYHDETTSTNASLKSNGSADPDLGIYVRELKQRFSCFIDYELVEKIVVPDACRIPAIFFTTRGQERYQRSVRFWVANNTGLTIYERVKEAFADTNQCDGKRCTVPYLWFVLLVREILILSPYAQKLGALVRLGARELDPCDPSFRFFALRKAVWEILVSMAFKYTGGSAYDTFVSQQRVSGRCGNGHLSISMSQTQFSTLYSRQLPTHPDKIDYTDAFRECLSKLLNGMNGFDYLFLVRCLHLDSEDTRN